MGVISDRSVLAFDFFDGFAEFSTSDGRPPLCGVKTNLALPSILPRMAQKYKKASRSGEVGL